MAAGKNLTGLTFGKLTVTSFSHSNGTRYWNCDCECGKKTVVRGSRLLKGHTISCGCLISPAKNKSPNWKGFNDIPLNFYTTIKKNAGSRDIHFSISIEYLWDLYIKQDKKCALSGLPLSFGKNAKDNKSKTVSVDRKNYKLGYVEGNVQWVHKVVNIMKNKLSDEEFIFFCNNVYINNKRDQKKYALFIGRWQGAFHDGHKWLIKQALDVGKNVLIAIRDVVPDEKNIWTAEEVRLNLYNELADYISKGTVSVMIIPDIESVNYGRGVGYEIIEHVPPQEISEISATKIREQRRNQAAAEENDQLPAG